MSLYSRRVASKGYDPDPADHIDETAAVGGQGASLPDSLLSGLSLFNEGGLVRTNTADPEAVALALKLADLGGIRASGNGAEIVELTSDLRPQTKTQIEAENLARSLGETARVYKALATGIRIREKLSVPDGVWLDALTKSLNESEVALRAIEKAGSFDANKDLEGEDEDNDDVEDCEKCLSLVRHLVEKCYDDDQSPAECNRLAKARQLYVSMRDRLKRVKEQRGISKSKATPKDSKALGELHQQVDLLSKSVTDVLDMIAGRPLTNPGRLPPDFSSLAKAAANGSSIPTLMDIELAADTNAFTLDERVAAKRIRQCLIAKSADLPTQLARTTGAVRALFDGAIAKGEPARQFELRKAGLAMSASDWDDVAAAEHLDLGERISLRQLVKAASENAADFSVRVAHASAGVRKALEGRLI